MDSYLKTLTKRVICREAAIRCLYSLIGIPSEPLPESIFLYGHVATGKSLIVETLLRHLKYNFSIINCVEHLNGKHIFEYILNDLSPLPDDSDGTVKPFYRCDRMLDFVLYLKKLVVKDNRPVVVVLDKCERMRDMDVHLLPAFLRLQELSGVNVCTILISDIVWEKFRVKTGMFEPIKIHFSQYTREEMAQILLLYKPANYDEEFYKNYLNLFLSVFFRFCRDLHELRYMAENNFLKYIEPIESGQCEKDNIAALWRNISPTLKSTLEVIYLRVSADNFMQHARTSREIESTTKLALSFELPFYAKYMLIAAYFASYNPAKEDKRLFMKQSSKKKKKATISKRVKTSTIQSGPRTFPISRMLAIFCAIIEEKVDLNANLFSAISTLCQLGLLSNVGDNNLDEAKYKCLVSYEFITIIAKTVGFNVTNYLPDFM